MEPCIHLYRDTEYKDPGTKQSLRSKTTRLDSSSIIQGSEFETRCNTHINRSEASFCHEESGCERRGVRSDVGECSSALTVGSISVVEEVDSRASVFRCGCVTSALHIGHCIIF